MAKVTPNQVFPSYSSDETQLVIPYSNLPGLDNSESDGNTGDIRALVLGFVEQVFSQINQLPDEDKPTGFSITKSNPVGVGLNKIRQAYTISLVYSYDPNSTSFDPDVIASSGN